MTCYHPLIRVEYQNVFKTAKDGHQYKVAKLMSVDNYEKFNEINEESIKILRIPCGKCIGCRLDYSKQWALRCLSETKTSGQSWFITLTYDDEHLYTPSEMVDRAGNVYPRLESWRGCLKPKDMTDFLKRLRSYWKYHYNQENIRFFYCGEYGGEGQRPHYHMIIFNLPIPKEELKPLFISDNYDQIYECKLIQDIWQNGIISIGEVTFSSCAYVARYITKKQFGSQAEIEYCKNGQIPEFVRMSRKPGLGKAYFDQAAPDIYQTDEMFATTCKGTAITSKPPHYFDKCLEKIEPDIADMIKESRRRAVQAAEEQKQTKTSLTLKDQMFIDEKTKRDKATSLKRTLD